MKASLLCWFTLSVSCASVLAVRPARAWDSHLTSRIRTLPHQLSAAGFGPELADGRYYTMFYLKDAIGSGLGVPSDSAEQGLTGLFTCPEPHWSTPDTVDLSQCRLVSSSSVPTGGGWVNARKSGEIPHDSEHSAIARVAVERSGVPAATLFAPFWVRYPGKNGLVGSRIGDSLRYAVGQSVQPAALEPDEFSYVTRSVNLYELAETPDSSNSLSDWANGNELCPLRGVAGAYRANDVEACHDFMNAMGAINVTHFAPLNREMWRYYHGLALKQMAECQELASIPQKFYQNWDELYDYEYKFVSDAHTEAHECERLAMAYEMFGQHFMQDAWSVGHMWHRWGEQELADFPFHVVFGPAPADIPAANEAPRKALIAGVVGAYAGMLHGAKSTLVDKVRSQIFDNTRDADLTQKKVAALTRFGHFDDPLNGGHFSVMVPLLGSLPSFIGQDVAWRGVGDERYRGAGDLFWDPLVRSIEPIATPVVSSDVAHETQRQRLLDCTAASIRRVYEAGPKVHGPLHTQVAEWVLEDPDSDRCWEHWADNMSMLGSVGVVDVSYLANLQPLALGSLVTTVANVLVLDKLGGDAADGELPSVNFPRRRVEDIPPDEPEQLALAIDRDRALRNVFTQANLDQGVLRLAFQVNATLSPEGSHSAKQRFVWGSDFPLLLGVGPAEDHPGPRPSPESAPAPLGVNYVDKLPEAATTPSELALSRMFWRGDLRRTCSAAIANEAALVNQLRDECITDITEGGDVESCTACVAMAELLVPNCGDRPNDPIGDSKCSAAGVLPSGIAQAGLPAWWFDNYGRVMSTSDLPEPWDDGYHYDACTPAYHMATQWCTNVNGWDGWTDYNTDFRSTEFEVLHEEPCGTPFLPVTRSFGIFHDRYARLGFETYPDLPERPWVIPKVWAYESKLTVTQNPESPCDDVHDAFWEDDLDEKVAFSVPELPPEEFLSSSYYLGPEQPRCGVTQRVFTVNRSCDEVTGLLRVPDPPLETFHPLTGAFAANVPGTSGTSCYVREPRRFVATCPPGLECTPGGECVAMRFSEQTFSDMTAPPFN
jgi:hypothetical protein